jgi:hypothetical protein
MLVVFAYAVAQHLHLKLCMACYENDSMSIFSAQHTRALHKTSAGMCSRMRYALIGIANAIATTALQSNDDPRVPAEENCYAQHQPRNPFSSSS